MFSKKRKIAECLTMQLDEIRLIHLEKGLKTKFHQLGVKTTLNLKLNGQIVALEIL